MNIFDIIAAKKLAVKETSAVVDEAQQIVDEANQAVKLAWKSFLPAGGRISGKGRTLRL